MPSRKFVCDPKHWRFRAEETRTVADQMTHEESRTIMRRIANDYDRLAKLAEEQLADQERGATGDNRLLTSVRALPCQNESLLRLRRVGQWLRRGRRWISLWTGPSD